MLCPSLAKIQRNQVDFDPRNSEHLKAFEMLCVGDEDGTIRQHPTLRFNVHEGYHDVRSMMLDIVAREFIRIYR